jgi:hypothetical protein
MESVFVPATTEASVGARNRKASHREKVVARPVKRHTREEWWSGAPWASIDEKRTQTPSMQHLRTSTACLQHTLPLRSPPGLITQKPSTALPRGASPAAEWATLRGAWMKRKKTTTRLRNCRSSRRQKLHCSVM